MQRKNWLPVILRELAADADALSDPPTTRKVLDLLDALDRLLIRVSRLIPPDDRPDTLYETCRALFTMSATPPPDIEAAAALVRVATRAVVRAHRLRSLAYSKPEGIPYDENP